MPAKLSFSTVCTVVFTISLLLSGAFAYAQDAGDVLSLEEIQQGKNLQVRTLNSLADSLALQETLEKRIDDLGKELETATSDVEALQLKEQLGVLQVELDSAEEDFNYLATGTERRGLLEPGNVPFDFQEEFFSLLKPAMKEIKDMTSGVRKKSELRERIEHYQEHLPVAQEALESATRMWQNAEDPHLKQQLQLLKKEWERQVELVSGRLESSRLQLQRVQDNGESVGSLAQDYFKNFFQRRGLYLFVALFVAVSMVLFARLLHLGIRTAIPGYQAIRRSFRIRLFDLSYWFITLLLVLLAPLLVFYYVEDWLLLSLGILFLIGIGWTLMKTLPVYWMQVQLFLNIGSVREAERLELGGLPWRVRRINLFTELENTEAGLQQRLPISALIGMRSRPVRSDEPWFPVRRYDWTMLADGFFGKVTGISLEFVELIDLAGTTKNYPTSDFLENAPLNLSKNFRITQTFGITYDLQAASTQDIPQLLKQSIQKKLEQEGYTDSLIALQVEFQLANASSLDLVVLADFTGEVACKYPQLERAVQRWCVEAATQYDWEIPFAQVTFHEAK